MILRLGLAFGTDGDFGFNDSENLFDPQKRMYEGADVKYDYTEDGEKIYITLQADGNDDACRWAARDLMESLVCNIRTHKYYVIKYLYDLIIAPKEELLWSKDDVNYFDSIGGNYEGTNIRLIVLHEDNDTEGFDANSKTPKPNIQLWIESEECGGAAMYGEDGKWYWTFDGEKAEECNVNILRWSYL